MHPRAENRPARRSRTFGGAARDARVATGEADARRDSIHRPCEPHLAALGSAEFEGPHEPVARAHEV